MGDLDRRRDRRDGENPPAVGLQHALVVAAGPGVQDGDTLDGARFLEAADHVSPAWVLGVALGGGDDADRGAPRRAHRIRHVSRGGCGEERGDVASDPREHGLGLGIAEAHVVLDETGAVVTQHQPRVEHTPVVDSPASQLPERRLDDPVHRLVEIAPRDERDREE